jgi:hypothetical protein
MKTLRGRQYSFKQQIQIKLQNKVLGLLASDMDDSLTKAALQLLSVLSGHLQQRLCFSFLKTLRGRQYSLIQQTQFTRLRKLLDTLPSNMEDFLRRTTVFLHSLERGY